MTNVSNEGGQLVCVRVFMICHDAVSSACQRVIRECIVGLGGTHWRTLIALLRYKHFDFRVNEGRSHQSWLALFPRKHSILENRTRLLRIHVFISLRHLLKPRLRCIALVCLHHKECLERWRCLGNRYLVSRFLTYHHVINYGCLRQGGIVINTPS